MTKYFATHHHSVMRPILIAFAFTGFILTNCCDASFLLGNLIESSPDNYNLTTLNDQADTTVLDWSIWGEGSASLSPTDSKLGASGISDLTTVGSAPTLRYLSQFGDIGQASFQWSDGTPNSSSANVFAGIQYCDTTGAGGGAVGAGFALTMSGEVGVSRQADIWMGTHRGTTRVEASLNGSDPVFYDLSHSSGNKFGWATFTFTPDSNDDVLTITSTFITPADGSNLGNSYFFAAALSEASAVPEPVSAFLMLIGIGLLFQCRSKIAVRN